MSTFATKQSSHDSAMRKRGGPKNPSPLHERNLTVLSNGVTILQPKANCPCGGGCPRCQGEPGIQPKLRIGQPNDQYEQEADRVAEMVMRMPEPQVQRQVEPEEEKEEEELVQTKPVITPLIQHQAEPEEEEEEELIQTNPISGQMAHLIQSRIEPEEEESLLQTKPRLGHTYNVTPQIGANINAIRGGGSPLPQSVRAYFEPHFGYDFSDVRVHTDARAAETARSVKAKAFTVGGDVVFGAGQYSPEAAAGKRLLAHELKHVIQQQGVSPIIQRKDGEAVSSWMETARKARKARVDGNLKEAERLYQEAIVAAVAGAVFPANLAKTTPKTEDIRLDFKLSDFAETRSKEVPANETNYWRWIYFGPDSLMDTQAHTQAVITHELVHVGQYKKLWEVYKSDKSASKPSWEEYIKPYSLRERVLGPEELEAEVTSLDFLKQLSKDEQVLDLRSLFIAYIHTSTYTPAKGETMTITTIVARPQILDFYNKADAKLQERMGAALWWSLIKVGPAKETWQAVLRDLKQIAVKGYRDATLRPHYDEFLKSEGLKFSEIIGETEKVKPLQRRGARWGSPAEAPHDLEEVLRSPGQPLDQVTRAFFEPRFGHDFSNVRAHTNARAAETARSVNAQAFTVGREVFFGAGQYSPETAEGKRLLAHELTHTIQQKHLPTVTLPVQAQSGREQGKKVSIDYEQNAVQIQMRSGVPFIQRLVPGTGASSSARSRGILSFTMTPGLIADEVSTRGRPAGHNEGVEFELRLASNVSPSDFAIVQLVRGSMTYRNSAGKLHYVNVNLHGSTVPFRYRNWVVDSKNTNPEFGNYRIPPLVISSAVTDWGDEPGISPGSLGAELPVPTRCKVWFRTGIYRRPIPSTVSSFQSRRPTPLAEIRWAIHWCNEGSPPRIVNKRISPM